MLLTEIVKIRIPYNKYVNLFVVANSRMSLFMWLIGVVEYITHRAASRNEDKFNHISCGCSLARPQYCLWY